ncbi:MAG: DNA-binding protein [Ideonella sp.]|nr:DNA-binding protein [Ideonella sp.]
MTKEEVLTSRYGTLMTLVHLAQELHRSPDGLRISLRRNDGWAGRINQAKRRFGRRVYFDTANGRCQHRCRLKGVNQVDF